MRRTWVAGIAGALLAGGLSTGVVLAAGAEPDHDNPSSSTPAAERRAGADNGRALGPPSWAHAKQPGAKSDDHRAWQEAWRALTPEQRKQTMRDLAKAHHDGMRDFAACVADARGADRAECDKPLPPGLAKRQL